MYDKIIVPLDGSDRAARALEVAATLAGHPRLEPDPGPGRGPGSGAGSRVGDATEVVLTSVVPSAFAAATATRLQDQALAAGVRQPSVQLHVSNHPPAGELLRSLRVDDRSLLCMTTTGRSHLGQVTGSVAEALLRSFSGPFLLIGPECQTSRFTTGGTMVVALDGSALADEAVPLARAWADAYRFELALVHVSRPGDDAPPDDVTVVHDPHPAEALVDHARAIDASLITMTTHGRTGLGRLLMGSVAIDVVRHAPCPVLVHRPPHMRS